MIRKLYFILIMVSCFSFVLPAEGWKETRNIIFTPQNGKNIELLNPEESVSAKVRLQQINYPARRFLRVVGNLKMPVPYEKRGEEMFRRAEFLIDDNLDSVITRKEKYSLYFKGDKDNFERHAYYRITNKLFKPGELTVTLPVVKKQLLDIDSLGEFGLKIEVFYEKKGRFADDIYDKPDSILFISVPEGNSKYKKITQTFILPEKTACLLLQVGGTGFSGECWVESPQLRQNGKLICSIPFVKHAQRSDDYNYWVGTNLSTRSWPMWQLDVNGKTAFKDNCFDRASNVNDFYILLPSDLKEGDDLKLTLKKEEHRAAYSYELHALEIIEESARNFEVISVPKYIKENALFGALVETNVENVLVRVQASENISPRNQEVLMEKPGLHVIEMRARQAGQSASIQFQSPGHTENARIHQIIDKVSDNIYLSSGDEIYIDKEYEKYDYFFKWYISNRVGNWYQFRPSYQWSGFRIADSNVIRHYVELLDQMRIPYAWQVEGRTLAGSRINPSLDVLNTSSFRGKQAHENDGGYYYWQHFKYKGLFSDMAARNRPYGGIFAKHRPIYTNHGTYIHYDPKGVKDMADGARKLVANFRYSKGESTRHTGPSTLFRYLYQAGYDWLGAEQMYGPEETILSSLRGASRAYSRPNYGSLHAMQWGSFPFTDPKHALRLYMSLAVAYMHGSSHMNTEEALWTDEYMNDRYSESGKAHLYAQHQMLDFVETHTRRGELMSNIAVIQGRNDAWKSFGRGSLWSQEGEKWKFNKACESFDLLKVFYPENQIDGCGPNGWFTSTPYGTVDLLPIEAPIDVMNKYKAMIFLGWNTYDSNDFLRIKDYVYNGGTLLLSAAHLNSELQPDQPVSFPKDDSLVREMLGNDYQQMRGKNVISYGNGKIIYFADKAYPIEDILKTEYVSEMRNIAADKMKEESVRGWIKPVGKVGFTVWDKENRRTIYLLNADWQNPEKVQESLFTYGVGNFVIPVRHYHIETIHCINGLALHPYSNTTDILSVDECSEGWNVKVQTTGKDEVEYMDSLTGTKNVLHFNKGGIHSVFVKK